MSFEQFDAALIQSYLKDMLNRAGDQLSEVLANYVVMKLDEVSNVYEHREVDLFNHCSGLVLAIAASLSQRAGD